MMKTIGFLRCERSIAGIRGKVNRFQPVQKLAQHIQHMFLEGGEWLKPVEK
jgi:hypothetical protein